MNTVWINSKNTIDLPETILLINNKIIVKYNIQDHGKYNIQDHGYNSLSIYYLFIMLSYGIGKSNESSLICQCTIKSCCNYFP